MDQATPLVVYVAVGLIPGAVLLLLASLTHFASYGGDPERLGKSGLEKFKEDHQKAATLLMKLSAAYNVIFLSVLVVYLLVHGGR